MTTESVQGSLSPDRWKILAPLIDAAIELAPEQRPAFVADACKGDLILLSELEALLAAYEQRDSPIDRPAAARFARLFEGDALPLPAVLNGRYRIVRELGRGGMAIVYLARDLRHERNVAVKVLRAELAAVLGADRFLAEIRTTAQLQHPHILPLHDSGEAEGLLFYVMPFVEGESLRARLARERQLPIDEAVRIASEVASALDAAHRQGVIHRDIKPENILVHNGAALLADFGIALAARDVGPRLTHSGFVLGTPEYMSPEQATGGSPIDARSDVYALGTVVFEMLAGEPPFTGATASAVIAKRAAMPAPRVLILRATVPPAMETAVARALEREPANRYRTAGEFAEALQTSLKPRTSGDAVAPGAGVVGGNVRRSWRRATFALAGLGTILLLASRTSWHGETALHLDPNKIVVVPFRLAGADSSVTYLREGVVDLLSPMLTGQGGGPLAVDSRTAIATWNRVKAGGEGTADVARDVARQVGASRILFGTLVFAQRRVTLAASVVGTARGDIGQLEPVTGSVDSLQAVLDGIVARLLARNAAVPEQTIGALTSQSLPALRAYLDGRAAYRRAHNAEAIRDFTRALEIDSTFALAALDLATATTKLLRQQRVCRNSSCRSASVVPGFRDGGLGTDDALFDRAIRLAWQSRSKLGSRDLPLLQALRGSHAPRVGTAREMLGNLETAAAAAPDRAETQYFLGLILLYQGFAVGYTDPFPQAESRFLRAVALDSAYLGPLARLVDVAAYDHDTAKLRRYGAQYLSRDSTGATADYVRWRVAVGTGDSATTRGIRARFAALDVTTLSQILTASQMSGVALGDADRAARRIINFQTDPSFGDFYWGHMLALNRGRPHIADSILHLRAEHDSARFFFSRAFSTWDLLFGQGDSAEAEAGSRERARWLARDTVIEPAIHWGADIRDASRRTRQESSQDARNEIFQEGIWDWAHGRLTAAAERTRWLRQHDDSAPADVIDMLVATDARRNDAPALRARIDSAARSGCCTSPHHIELELAIAYERAGDDSAALRAVRRGKWRLPTMYLATYLLMEGRLADRIGDREGAIRAYEHYLALRSDPEPRLVPQRDTIQAEVTRLRARTPRAQTLETRFKYWARHLWQ